MPQERFGASSGGSVSPRSVWLSGAAWAILLWLWVLLACSPAARRADALFEAGDYAAAAAAYELETAPGAARSPSARTLYRLGVARATPGSASYDPAKALDAFGSLCRQYPASAYAAKVALPMALLAQVREAGAKRDALAADLEKHKTLLEASGVEVREVREERDRQGASIAQLKARLAEQEAVLTRLKREMEQLKRIDLGPQR